MNRYGYITMFVLHGLADFLIIVSLVLALFQSFCFGVFISGVLVLMF